MKTIKQIADELKVSKQQVYRYIKKNYIKESFRDEVGVMWYDDVAETRIKKAFLEKEHINEAHQGASSDVGVMQSGDVVETRINPELPKKECINEAHQGASSDVVFDSIISMLKTELNTKNELILIQQQTINELTATLENSTNNLQVATLQGQLSEKDDQLRIKDKEIISLIEINRYLSESINADRRNALAETIIDGKKLIENKNKPKKRGFFSSLFSKGGGKND